MTDIQTQQDADAFNRRYSLFGSNADKAGLTLLDAFVAGAKYRRESIEALEARKPLPEPRIEHIRFEVCGEIACGRVKDFDMAFARAIEAAHGIKGE